MPGGLHSDVGILARELECSLEFCHSDALLSVLSHGDTGDIDLIENYKLSFQRMNIYTEWWSIGMAITHFAPAESEEGMDDCSERS